MRRNLYKITHNQNLHVGVNKISFSGRRHDTVSRRQSLHGFTLIELLVVISMIALLLVILLPSLSLVKEQARCVVCQSNLRNIGLGLRVYLDTYEGRLPSAEPYPGSHGTRSQHWFMNRYLMSNLNISLEKDTNGEIVGPGQDRSVMTCPTHRHPNMTRESLPDYPAVERAYSLSYAANGTLGVSGKCNLPAEYRHENEFTDPSKAMMFCDGSGTEQVPGIVLFDGCAKSNFAFRHRGKLNLIFLDQHIESRSQQEIPFCTRFDPKRHSDFWYAKRR